MKIQDATAIAPLPLLEAEARRTPGRVSGPPGQPDRVSLSPEAQRRQSEEAERVAGIARQLAEHQYVIDFDRLAQAIVDKELL